MTKLDDIINQLYTVFNCSQNQLSNGIGQSDIRLMVTY